MSPDVLCRVLSLAVRIVGWRADDSGAALPRSMMVSIDVGDPHHHRIGGGCGGLSGGNNDRSVAERELRTVIANPQPLDESERAA